MSEVTTVSTAEVLEMIFRENEAKKYRPYLGMPNFRIRTYPSGWGDADLVYTADDGETWVFDHEDISECLLNKWREEHPNEPEPSDDVWGDYARDNIENECLDAIYCGYFAPGSHSWHDAYR